MDASVWYGVFWNHLVYPELAVDEVEDPNLTISTIHAEVMHGEFPHAVACLCLDNYSQLAAAERCERVQQLKRLIHRSLPTQFCKVLGFAHANSLYFCARLDKPSDERIRSAFIARMEQLRVEIAGTLAMPVTIGVAFLHDATIDSWRSAAQYAIVAQRSKVRLGANRVYRFDHAAFTACRSLDSYWDLAEALYQLVRSGDITRIDQVLQETIHGYFTHVYAPLTHLLTVLQGQVILMAQAARAVGVATDEVEQQTQGYLEAISTTYDYAQLRQIIEQSAAFYTTKVHAHYHAPSSRLVSATEEYLLAHLDDPNISLQCIADTLATNASYLSRCFKKAKGVGITEYINQQRVDCAKRLLLDRTRNITDIAFQLGFGSLQHFGRVFKAVAQCTPSEYRQSKNA